MRSCSPATHPSQATQPVPQRLQGSNFLSPQQTDSYLHIGLAQPSLYVGIRESDLIFTVGWYCPALAAVDEEICREVNYGDGQRIEGGEGKPAKENQLML